MSKYTLKIVCFLFVLKHDLMAEYADYDDREGLRNDDLDFYDSIDEDVGNNLIIHEKRNRTVMTNVKRKETVLTTIEWKFSTNTAEDEINTGIDSREIYNILSRMRRFDPVPTEKVEDIDVQKSIVRTPERTSKTAPTRSPNHEVLPLNQTTVANDIEDVSYDEIIYKNIARDSNKTSNLTTILETTTTTTEKPSIDIPALLAIIGNITYDYDMNLTEIVNETLQRMSLPTCKTPTTTPTTLEPTTERDYDFNTTKYGTIMAKCFVCGLEEVGVPFRAHCSDAFAGDFVPLTPVDPTSRGQIANFRKYCRFKNIFGSQRYKSEKKNFYGKWSGGCSVRWIDLSGIYTQRSCRNRYRATQGKHYLSKRMAKLEMALRDVDNGCIASPMASLVPLSRGISLYAKFHACVCTGSWCNASQTLVISMFVVWPCLTMFAIIK